MSTEHEKQLNRERQARWRAANPDRARVQGREKSKRYCLAHPQRVRSFQRRWRLERAIQKSKELIARLANPDINQTKTSNQTQTNISFEDCSANVRRDVFEKISKQAPSASIAAAGEGMKD